MISSEQIIQPHSMKDDWLSAAELKALTPAILVERVNAIKPLIAAHAQEAERIRHPVDVVMRAIRKTGILYHFVPKRYGGLEFGLTEFIDITMPIAEACASTAWVICFYMQHNFLAAQLPKAGQDEIFGAFPYTMAPGTAAPPAKAVAIDGGYEVTGRIKYASGAVHGDWAQLVANTAPTGEPPNLRFFMLPVDQITILDNWNVDGLAGTGSNDIVADKAFVPESRSVGFEDLRSGEGYGRGLYENPIYGVPVDILLNISSSIPIVGTARATVACFRERIIARAMPGSDGKPSIRPASQMRLAEAELAAHTAETLLHQAAADTEDAVRDGYRLTNEDRMRIRSRIAYAVDLSRHSVRIAFDGAGSSAHDLSNPIQRAMRDANMIASHAVYERDAAFELWGKVLTGSASPDAFKHHSIRQVKAARPPADAEEGLDPAPVV